MTRNEIIVEACKYGMLLGGISLCSGICTAPMAATNNVNTNPSSALEASLIMIGAGLLVICVSAYFYCKYQKCKKDEEPDSTSSFASSDASYFSAKDENYEQSDDEDDHSYVKRDSDEDEDPKYTSTLPSPN